jgi:hypothetical protein
MPTFHPQIPARAAATHTQASRAAAIAWAVGDRVRELQKRIALRARSGAWVAHSEWETRDQRPDVEGLDQPGKVGAGDGNRTHDIQLGKLNRS